MCDTVRPVPLKDNPLTRRYNGQTKPQDWMGQEEVSPQDAALVADMREGFKGIHRER